MKVTAANLRANRVRETREFRRERIIPWWQTSCLTCPLEVAEWVVEAALKNPREVGFKKSGGNLGMN